LLHVHYAIPHSVSALLARQMSESNGRRLPFVTTLHGTDITLVGADRSYLPITKFGIDQSDGVTSISNFLRDKTIETFGVTRPIEVITNFVNCDLYQRRPEGYEAKRARFALPNERLLVHLSNFRPVKRVLDVIEIFARVAKRIPARLMLMGDGPERSEAEWLVHSHGLQSRVHFLGKQDSVHELLPLADLMLMPSQLESFGLAALEAMACNVPTIATNVGGIPELIDHGRTGLLFPVGAVSDMADAALGLFANQKQLTEMSVAGREVAQARYCTTRIIPLYEEYYERVVAEDAVADGARKTALPSR
jgi:N-acetyl-alpha-D-glucosaminyl L-malate synthase BshA